MCPDCARERAAREEAERERDDHFAVRLLAETERDRLQERLDQFEAYGMPNVAAALDRVAFAPIAAESALAAEREAHEKTRGEVNALRAERNAALELAEKRGAAYDMTWREVESLRERLDKEEEERGRQYGLRVQAEAEVGRLMALVREWLDGNARLGRPKSIADQRFLNGLNAAMPPTFTHWSGTATKPEEPMSLTRINREERVALTPFSARHHMAQILDALVEVVDEVEAEVGLRLASGDTRWAFAKIKVVIDLETES